MYSGLSIVISLGLILIIILTHFNFKSKLYNFENVLKNNEKTFMDKIKKMKENLDNNYGKLIGPIDCKGRWVCNEKCIREFQVDVLPKYGGEECPTGSAHDSGLGSCIPGETGDDGCPLHQDCVWRWSQCGSNCKRSIIIDRPQSGDGKSCPSYNDALEESEKLKQYRPKIEDNRINRIYEPCIDEDTLEEATIMAAPTEGNCSPSKCEGDWGSCGSNCKKEWITTKESTPANEYQNYLCPNRYRTETCSGDLCEDQDCEYHWLPCNPDTGLRYKRYNSSIEITKHPVGNGKSCPTKQWENDNMIPCN